MSRIWLAFSLALLLASFGCVLLDQQGHPIGTADMVSQKPVTVAKYVNQADLTCKEMTGAQPCYCMACTNKTSYSGFFSWLFNYYDSTLVGGNCSIAGCNLSDYDRIVTSDSSTQMRTFALGSGQSFVSTGNANLFCNYSLQLATKWMKGGAGAAPRVPQASRAACWLERSMLPVYIYYGNGAAIDPARTGQIAQAFNAADSGPVMLTTEVAWDSADSAQVAGVRGQVLAIDSCDKCLTVLAVKPGDTEALYSVMGMPGNLDHSMYDKIDAVGFGFRANDYTGCDPAQVMGEAVGFSRYILQKYNKPTVWLYAGVSEGNSSDGSCQWTAANVQDFYSSLLTYTGGMASNGILGVSLYEFVDGSGALECNGVQGCDFGLLYANGSQKHPALNAWSDMCQEVNINSLARKPLIFSKNGNGNVCDVPGLRNDQALMHASQEISSGQGLLLGEVKSAVRVKNLGCGEICPENSTMKKPITYDNTGNGFDPNHCDKFPIIDERADDLDISATYLKAEFEQESGFDPYAISLECKDEDFAGCNPQAYSAAQICELAGMASDPLCKRDLCTGTNPVNGKKLKPCAYGLAQCIEYPGIAYTAANPYGQAGTMPDVVKACGGEKYNPFDPGMSACCGAKKFADALRSGPNSAEAFINSPSNWAELSKCSPDGMMPDEKGWASYYLASNKYGGITTAVLLDFVAQRDANGACCANSGSSTCYKHYIDYLRSRATPNDDTVYGAKVMSRYRAAVSACSSDCPR